MSCICMPLAPMAQARTAGSRSIQSRSKRRLPEPTKVLLQNANTANPSFVAPAATSGLASLAFQVTHTSAQGKSASTTLSVTVTGAPIKTATEAAKAGR